MSDEIKSGIGPGFLPEVFGGKSFIHCVVELIKNARDWGATLLALTTQSKRFEVEILDNGSGMSRDNRNAFASVNMTTAHGPRQSGKFCTGTKQMLFSHCTGVMVVTAPEEEPDWVLIFSFSREEYEALVLKRGTITPERVKKTAESWPHPFPFGTKITYTLADPGSKGIYRSDALAAELAARLPLKFSEYVTVDGKSIPPKELVGEVYALVENPAQLGEVRVELYHPAKRHREEGLRVTAVEVGEATIGNLFHVLTDEQREIFPTLYLLREVCGVISTPFLKDHANEDRFTLSGKIADDPRTLHLLRFLRKIAVDVQRRLKITTHTANDSPDDAAQIDSVIDRFNLCFNPEGKRPTRFPRGDETTSEDSKAPTPGNPPEQKPITLDCPSEVEIGKPFVVRGKIRKDLRDRYGPKDIHFSTLRSHAQVTEKTDGSLTLMPEELGSGSVTADIPGTPYSTTVGFRVVSELLPRLSSTVATVKRGSEHLLTVVHKEKLPQGTPPRWVVTSEGGSGELKPEGYRAIFRATRNGHLVVTCTVESITLTCDIDVVDELGKLLPIEDQFFRVRTYGAEGMSDPAARVAAMHPGDENLHDLVVQRTAPGYQEALQRGCLDTYLTLLIMREYARFKRVELEKRQLDREDVPSFLEEIEGHAQVLFETFLKHGNEPVA